jgi:hypothetical protein
MISVYLPSERERTDYEYQEEEDQTQAHANQHHASNRCHETATNINYNTPSRSRQWWEASSIEETDDVSYQQQRHLYHPMDDYEIMSDISDKNEDDDGCDDEMAFYNTHIASLDLEYSRSYGSSISGEGGQSETEGGISRPPSASALDIAIDLALDLEDEMEQDQQKPELHQEKEKSDEKVLFETRSKHDNRTDRKKKASSDNIININVNTNIQDAMICGLVTRRHGQGPGESYVDVDAKPPSDSADNAPSQVQVQPPPPPSQSLLEVVRINNTSNNNTYHPIAPRLEEGTLPSSATARGSQYYGLRQPHRTNFCSACGKPRRNHVCEAVEAEVFVKATETQTVAVNPHLLVGGELCLTGYERVVYVRPWSRLQVKDETNTDTDAGEGIEQEQDDQEEHILYPRPFVEGDDEKGEAGHERDNI